MNLINRFYVWLMEGVSPPYLHEPDGSHCGLCGAWVEGDPGDKNYPWNWRWTMCSKCIAIGEMSETEFTQYLSDVLKRGEK